jgi:hypothetical protein
VSVVSASMEPPPSASSSARFLTLNTLPATCRYNQSRQGKGLEGLVPRQGQAREEELDTSKENTRQDSWR